MSVKHYPWSTERTCGDCGTTFTPAVYTKPDPKGDLCGDCITKFLKSVVVPPKSEPNDD